MGASIIGTQHALLLDNTPHVYRLQEDMGVPIRTFTDPILGSVLTDALSDADLAAYVQGGRLMRAKSMDDTLEGSAADKFAEDTADLLWESAADKLAGNTVDVLVENTTPYTPDDELAQYTPLLVAVSRLQGTAWADKVAELQAFAKDRTMSL